MSRRFRSAVARRPAQPDAQTLRETRRTYQTGQAMRYVIRPVLMALLVTAMAAGVLAIVQLATGDSRWSTMLLLLFCITLEGIYTTNWLQQPSQLPLDRAAYRGAELLLLIIGLRLGTWILFASAWPTRETLLGYLRNPGGLFLDPTFLISVGLALLMWRSGSYLSKLFYELEVSEFELQYFSLPLVERKIRADDQPIRLGRRELVANFTRYWLWGGIFLAVTIALNQLEARPLDAGLLAPLVGGGAELAPGLLAALLAYFLIGLWLLSQARLMEMDARWLLNGVSKDEQMRRTWQRTSLAILLSIALLAAFLPIGSTSALSQLVNLLLFALFFLANALIFAFTLPFAFILALLSRNGGAAALPPLRGPQEIAAQEAAVMVPLGETVTLVLSSAFWAMLIVGTTVALLYFVRERRQRAEEEKPDQLWAQLRNWLAALWASWHGRLAAMQIKTPTQSGSELDQGTPAASWRRRFRRFSRLPPREQVRYFYLLAVARASKEGVDREATETPLEFADDLQENWPAAEDALDDLTDAFLKARYSDLPVVADDLSQAKASWQVLRHEMKRERLKPPDNEEDEKSG